MKSKREEAREILAAVVLAHVRGCFRTRTHRARTRQARIRHAHSRHLGTWWTGPGGLALICPPDPRVLRWSTSVFTAGRVSSLGVLERDTLSSPHAQLSPPVRDGPVAFESAFVRSSIAAAELMSSTILTASLPHAPRLRCALTRQRAHGITHAFAHPDAPASNRSCPPRVRVAFCSPSECA